MVNQYLQTFVAGLFISLAGSLPLGMLNVTAMQIAAKENLNSAVRFAIGVTIIEMVYILLILLVIGRLADQTQLFYVFEIVSIGLLLVLAAASFMATVSKQQKNVVIDNNLGRFTLGISMSAMNPMQIPFWMGWIIYLLSQSLMVNSIGGNTIFTMSAGMGTFLALLVFILAGRKFSDLITRNKKVVNTVMGCLFLFMAIFQIIKLF